MTSPKQWFNNLSKVARATTAIATFVVLLGSFATIGSGMLAAPKNIEATRDSVHELRTHIDTLSTSALSTLRDLERLQTEQVCLQVAIAKHQDIDPCLVAAAATRSLR